MRELGDGGILGYASCLGFLCLQHQPMPVRPHQKKERGGRRKIEKSAFGSIIKGGEKICGGRSVGVGGGGHGFQPGLKRQVYQVGQASTLI